MILAVAGSCGLREDASAAVPILSVDMSCPPSAMYLSFIFSKWLNRSCKSRSKRCFSFSKWLKAHLARRMVSKRAVSAFKQRCSNTRIRSDISSGLIDYCTRMNNRNEQTPISRNSCLYQLCFSRKTWNNISYAMYIGCVIILEHISSAMSSALKESMLTCLNLWICSHRSYSQTCIIYIYVNMIL